MFIELDLFYVFDAVLDIGPFGGFAVQPAALQVKDAFACRSCLFCDNVDVLNACHIAFANHLNGDAAQGGNRDKDYFFLIGELKKQSLDLLGAFRLSATGRPERVFPDDKRPGDFAGIKRNEYFCRVQLLTFLLS